MSKKPALVFLIAFALWIVSGFISVEFFGLLTVFYFIALVVLLFRLIIQAIKKPRSKATAKKATAAARSEDALVFPYEYDGKTMAYQYEDVGVYVPHVNEIAGIKKGQIAILESEPENEYDPGAVAVYASSAIYAGRMTRIGYLYRGTLQRMANDWLKRDDPIFAQFSYVNMNAAIPGKDGVKINIVFYE